MIARASAMIVAAALMATSLTIDAQARGGRGGGGFRGGGMSRPSAPMSRPSMPSRPPSASTRPSSGFNLNNDIMRPPPGTPVSRPGTAPGGLERPSQLPGTGNRPERPGGGGNRPERPGGGGGNRPDRPQRPPVQPVVPVLPTWGWNGGYPWYPAPGYYGGGFWGPWGVGFTTAIVLGEVTDEETKEKVVSYEVAPDSPGAKVLQAYGLTQVACGPEGLVVIHGPENSVICATANSTVAAGEYDLNVDNLTIYTR